MNSYPSPGAIATGNTGDVTTTGEYTGLTAPGSGSRLRIQSIWITTNSTTAAERFDLRDGASGATIVELPVPAQAIAGGCIQYQFPVPLALGDNKVATFFKAGNTIVCRITVVGFREKFTS